MNDTRETIEREFKAGDLAAIDAIERLEQLGYDPKDAEEIVDTWEWNGR